MSTLKSAALLIPYALRGRDFDENYRHFTFPLFEMAETIPYYDTENTGLNTEFCSCMIYTKCQTLEIYHPITLKLLHETIINANKKDNNNNINNSFYLKCYIGNIGRTSCSWFIDLIYKNIIYSSMVEVNVHINPDTLRPMPNCDKLIKYKNKYKYFNNNYTKKRGNELKKSINILTNSLNKYNNNIIYSQIFSLNRIDRDWNKHTNQAVYTKLIENVLYEYHNEFTNGNYFIIQLDHLFLEEMKILTDGSQNECNVKILIHNKELNGKEEIIGVIEQYNHQCLQYRVILKPKYNAKSYLNSKL